MAEVTITLDREVAERFSVQLGELLGSMNLDRHDSDEDWEQYGDMSAVESALGRALK